MPPVDPQSSDYHLTLPKERVEQIRIWHDRAYIELLRAASVEQTFDYFGFSIVVPSDVMPITPVSHLLGERVLSEVMRGDRRCSPQQRCDVDRPGVVPVPALSAGDQQPRVAHRAGS